MPYGTTTALRVRPTVRCRSTQISRAQLLPDDVCWRGICLRCALALAVAAVACQGLMTGAGRGRSRALIPDLHDRYIAAAAQHANSRGRLVRSVLVGDGLVPTTRGGAKLARNLLDDNLIDLEHDFALPLDRGHDNAPMHARTPLMQAQPFRAIFHANQGPVGATWSHLDVFLAMWAVADVWLGLGLTPRRSCHSRPIEASALRVLLPTRGPAVSIRSQRATASSRALDGLLDIGQASLSRSRVRSAAQVSPIYRQHVSYVSLHFARPCLPGI